VRSDVEVALCGSGSRVDLFGLATAIAGQHIDNHVCADHLSPASLSTQTYRSIVDDGGRIVFNGKVIVRPDSQGIDAHQRSDNLLLSRNGEIDTKPELEIYADDVRCSHGATIGELDENELFYLRSRGIPADAARRLLTFAFANRILTRISNPDLRGYLATRISGVLTDALPMPDELITPAGEVA
jgi:Fe-S cluster assembly protein SufD